MTEVIYSPASLWLALGVLGIPLLSALICLLIPQKYAWLAPITGSVLLLITFVCSAFLFLQLSDNHELTYSWPWFSINQKILHASLLLDKNAVVMVMVVSLVSFLVHLYSIAYMAEDQALVRYFGMLGFFTFAMLGLVMSGNLLILFCFWELVGFSSYRLIGHWHEKPAAAKASTKAFLINRVGDIGFLIGLMILWSWQGNLDIITHLNLESVSPFWLTTAGICMFIGVIGKSAQFPLFHWLPDAMEGPTPVSALIHAATMVAAGVFLLIRIESLFTENALMIIAITGMITAIIGAIGALFQYDLKKILAYSTISQLGLMVMAMGAGATQGGYMHLLHHAFFKAGLFLGAGAIIHAMHQAYHHKGNVDVQDIRNLGGLRKKLPITFITFMISAAALAGLPFTSGFVSKEVILTQMSAWTGNELSWKWLVMLGAWAVTFLTPFYTFRLVWFIFFAKPKHDIDIAEVPFAMRIPMLVLSLSSLALLISFNPFHISSIINVMMSLYPHTNYIITLLSTLVILIALVSAFSRYRNHELNDQNKILPPHFYLDWVSDYALMLIDGLTTISHWIDRKVIDKIIHGLTYLQLGIAHVTGWSDRYLVDGVVHGVAYSAKGIGSLTRSLANGKIQSYLLWALAGLLIFILWILY